MADSEKKVRVNIEAGDGLSSSLEKMSGGLNKFKGELGEAENQGTRLSGAFINVSGALSVFSGAIAATGLTLLVRDLAEAGIASERLRNSFAAATGGLATGTAELAFVRQEANRLGLDLQSAADSYMKLAASAKGTRLEGQQIRDIFSAVAGASTALGLSADQANGALLAISQMMSKGTVQAEELRGQLGERLPGAFQIAARAMGVTTAELDKMLKDGKVIADDFLPKFADEVAKTFPPSEKAVHGLNAELSRLKTSFFELEAASMDAGGNTLFSSIAREVTELNKDLAQNIRLMGDWGNTWELMKNKARIWGGAAAAAIGQAASGDFSAIPDTFGSAIHAGKQMTPRGVDYGGMTLMRPDTFLNDSAEKPDPTNPKGKGDKKSKGLTEDQRITLGQGKDELKFFLDNVYEENAAELAGEAFSRRRFELLSGEGLRGSGKGALGGDKRRSDIIFDKPASAFSLGSFPLTGSSFNTNRSTMTPEEQNQFDNAAMLSKWDAENTAYRAREEQSQFDHQQRLSAIQTETEMARLSMLGREAEAEDLRFTTEQERITNQLQWKLSTTSMEESEKQRIIAESYAEIDRLQMGHNQRKLANEGMIDRAIREGQINLARFEKAAWSDKVGMVSSNLVQMSNSVANSNQAMFTANKVFRISEAGMELYAGVSKTFNSYPYPWNIAMAAAHTAMGVMHIAEIASASYGGANSSPGGSYGGGTPTSPVVTQPVGQVSQPLQQITIEVKADAFYGDRQVAERWVEDVFAPTIRQALGRNVDFGFVTK